MLFKGLGCEVDGGFLGERVIKVIGVFFIGISFFNLGIMIIFFKGGFNGEGVGGYLFSDYFLGFFGEGYYVKYWKRVDFEICFRGIDKFVSVRG